jgi:CspA family cold shock protein
MVDDFKFGLCEAGAGVILFSRESRRGGIEANDPDKAAVSVMTSDGSDPDGLGSKNSLRMRAEGQTSVDEVPGDLVEVAGTIKWFDVAKGYGFIVPDGGGADVLLHVTSLRRDGFQTAHEGARIVVEATARARGLQTFRVLSMDDSTAVHPAQLPPPRTHVSVTPTSGLERAEVKWFNRLRGFGFLSRGPGTPDIFVHMETLRRYGMTELRPGQWVLVRFGDGSKGLMAAEVRPDGVAFPASH